MGPEHPPPHGMFCSAACVPPVLPPETVTRPDITRGVISLLVSEAARMREFAWSMLERLGVRRDR